VSYEPCKNNHFLSLLAVLSTVSLFAQAKPRLAILPFTGGSPEDAETIVEFFSYEDEINRVFTRCPGPGLSKS
jgi:hypothetical protein